MTAAVQQIARRRTFAIISHPDAGKTTLTEKLLWFGGAIQVAGEIRARKAARHATSDWMELEKQRGISVTSSVMQFPYRDCVINLLDTPGHEDFSEDTYRTLTAVDSAVMVIDSVNGVEAQTIKLLNVCRLRATITVEFSLDGLLRSNLKDRAEIYAKLVQNGLKTRNECRQLENDPPVPGGDELTAQTNLAPLKMLGTMQGAGNAGASDAIAQ